MADDERGLRAGDTAYDRRLKKVGQVIETLGAIVALRPIDGGDYWNAELRHVRHATARETAEAWAVNLPTSATTS